MSTQFIEMNITFNASIDEIFSRLGDHEELGKILKTKIRRIKDGVDDVNGLGSVRKIHLAPLVDLEETVTAYEPLKLIEYTITSKSPIKNHLGRLMFNTANGQTNLHYTIQFEADTPIPFFGNVLKVILGTMINKRLQQFAAAQN